MRTTNVPSEQGEHCDWKACDEPRASIVQLARNAFAEELFDLSGRGRSMTTIRPPYSIGPARVSFPRVHIKNFESSSIGRPAGRPTPAPWRDGPRTARGACSGLGSQSALPRPPSCQSACTAEARPPVTSTTQYRIVNRDESPKRPSPASRRAIAMGREAATQR